MKFSLLPTLFLFCLAHISQAQDQMFKRISVPAWKAGKALKYPFAGGMNNPQFSAADLNNDGIQDLVIFDRGGNAVLTFLNQGIPGEISYTFVPEYACFFPKLVDYALLRDYNNDGAMDIFCAALKDSPQEMQVFQGYYEDNVLKFKPFTFFYPNGPTGQVYDPLYIWYPSSQPGFFSNLSISKTDVPAVDDIDGDGDLDIVTFAAGTTTSLWFLRNESVEMGYGLDSLKFRKVDDCWGRFFENGMEACRAVLSNNPNVCSPGFAPDQPVDDRAERHPGATVLTYDQDNDGDKEVVLGNIAFACLGMFTNGGTPEQGWMTALDTAFPIYSTPVELSLFPASFYLDLDNDGKKDLLVAPNSPSNSEDQKCAWFYRNTAATGHYFELKTQTLLVDEMIDLGTVSHPAIADVNSDGLLDLVAGNNGLFNPSKPGSNYASLSLFLNIGTPTQPRFRLENEDWLALSEYSPNDFDFAPAFGDLDGDEDLDLLVGNYGGWLYYFQNIAGPNNPMAFQQSFDPMWVSMDPGSSSTPAMLDLDKDGLVDILMGEYQGNVNFYKNIGTLSDPKFATQPTISKIGGVDTELVNNGIGYSTPIVLQTIDGPNLITGGINGQLEAYSNVTATADPSYTPISMTWGNIDEGSRSSPALADLDNDGILELVVGNQRGGLSLYKTVMVDCVVPVKTTEAATLPLTVSPNPAHTWVRVQLPTEAPAHWRAYNALGQLASSGETAAGNFFHISVTNWETGVYFLEVIAGQQRGVAKVVVRH